MDTKTLQAFRTLIKQSAPEQVRFKLNAKRNDVEEILQICYEEMVSRRRIKFEQSDFLQSCIRKATTWLIEDRRPGLLLYGNYGAGKSTMGKAISLLVSKYGGGRFVIQTTARDLCNLAATDIDRFNDLKTKDMLYIDEVGREALTVQNWGNKINPFIEVLEYRYDKQLFTILTANLTDEEILERYGVYIDERIAENFDKINYTNKSYRTGK